MPRRVKIPPPAVFGVQVEDAPRLNTLEIELLCILWDANRPVRANDIYGYYYDRAKSEGRPKAAVTTIITNLSRMANAAGLLAKVEDEESGKSLYYPLKSRREMVYSQMNATAKALTGQSLGFLLSQTFGERTASDDELNEGVAGVFEMLKTVAETETEQSPARTYEV